VPVTFASFEARGSFTDRGTDGMAAWWKMPSAPGKVSMRRSRSVMLPRQTSPGEEVLDLLPAGPVARLSMMAAAWCCAKVSARF
jgi:hypothetical protein